MAMWCPRRKGGGGCHGNGCPAWGCWGGMGGDSNGDMAPALPVLHSTPRVTQGPSALHHGDPLPCSLKVPCPHSPILPHPTGLGRREETQLTPMALGPSAHVQEPQGHRGPGWDEVQGHSPRAQHRGRGSQARTKTGRAWGFWGVEPGPCYLTRHMPPTPSCALDPQPSSHMSWHSGAITTAWPCYGDTGRAALATGTGAQGEQREHRGAQGARGHRPLKGQLVLQLRGELIGALRALR